MSDPRPEQNQLLAALPEVERQRLFAHQGLLGIALFMGGETTPSRAVVQNAGHGFRLKGRLLKSEFNRGGTVMHLLLLYTQALITQMAQTAACTRLHLLEARLARCLLMTQDRAYSDELHITHEFLAYMLGVRRVGITKAAGSLQAHKLIDYSRGLITVLDRSGLEAASCGCYRADKATYERIMN